MRKIKRSAKGWRKKCDDLWSLTIKIAAGYFEICGKPEMQAHHLITKKKSYYYRWDFKNGIALCPSCHFMAHNNTAQFYIQLAVAKQEQYEWLQEACMILFPAWWKPNRMYPLVLEYLESTEGITDLTGLWQHDSWQQVYDE